jgi:hypothetical protein
VGDHFTITVQTLDEGFEPHWQLFDPAGQTILTGGKSAGNPVQSFEYTVQSNDSYTLAVGAGTSQLPGTFLILVEFRADPATSDLDFSNFDFSTETCDEITYGQTEEGAISTGGEEDYFKFWGVAGEIITIKMIPVDDSLQPTFKLLDPDGQTEKPRNQWSDKKGGKLKEYQLVEKGCYQIMASSKGHTTGRYELTLRKLE